MAKKKKETGKKVKKKEEMTPAEIGRLTERGRKELRIMLDKKLEQMSDKELGDRVARIFENEYKLQMETNEEFFNRVNEFLTGRKSAKEKQEFFTKIGSYLNKEGRIAHVIAARYPDDYRLPKEVISKKEASRAAKLVFSYWNQQFGKAISRLKECTKRAFSKCKSAFSSKTVEKGAEIDG